jgi:hypothetical protein
MHGHWEFPKESGDGLRFDEGTGDSINVGIAIVVPASKILKVLERPSLVEHRKQLHAAAMLKHAASPDIFMHNDRDYYP